MTLFCLSCRHVTSGQTVTYCSFCNKSFGATRCEKQHASSMLAKYCTVCSSDQLSKPTAYLPLGWVFRALTLLVLCIVWRVGQRRAGEILGTIWCSVIRVIAFLFDTCPACVVQRATDIVIWFAAIYAVCGILPEPYRKPARKLLLTVPKLLWSSLSISGKAIGRLLVDRPKKSSDKAKRNG